jgi:hypothetical protein
MDVFRYRCLGVVCLVSALLPGVAGADWSEPGKAKLGIEYELEKSPHNAGQSDGLTLVPGIHLNNRWINMVEMLIEGARERDNITGERSTERKIGIRIRKDFPLTEDTKFVLRGLLGHAWQGEERHAYYYVEPSFRYSVGPVELMVGYRLTRGIDAGKENDQQKFRLGPSFELSEHDELEFRWARSWNLHTGQHVSDAYIVEYTRSF